MSSLWTRVSVKTSGSWDCPSSLARVSPPQPNDSLQQSAKQTPHLPRTECEAQQRGMTLADHTTAHNPESNSAVATETEPTASEQTLTEQRSSELNSTDSNLTEEHQRTSSHGPAPSFAEAPHAAVSDDKHAGEDFASALENFTTESEEAVGEDRVIKGTVLKLTATHVVVDIGTKSEGMLPLSEVLDHEGKPKVKPGDEIEVMREKGHTEDGYVSLSHQKAARIHAWEEIEKAHHEKRPIKAVVIERTKGGLTVDILGARAFLPGSQVDLRPIRNLDGMKGQTLEVTVIKVNKKRGNIVVSRKELLEGEQNEKRSKTLEHLEEGSVLTGVVKNLTEYGAFVDLGGLDGLLHITDMSWGRLTHPRDLVNVGDEIQVKVLKFDKEKQRVSLGFKQLTPDPWLDATERYPIGAQVRGRVLSVTDFGAFIEIEDGIDGLVHVSNLSWTKRIKHPSEVLKKGEKVRAIVLGVEPENRRLSLGVKQLQPDVWDTFFAQHRVGDVIKGKILRTAQFGAFVEIAEGVEGLCHVSEPIDAKGKAVSLEVGDDHEFKIFKMNQEEKKVGLSIKAIGEEATRAEVESYKESSNKGKGNKGQGSSNSSSSSANAGSTTL